MSYRFHYTRKVLNVKGLNINAFSEDLISILENLIRQVKNVLGNLIAHDKK